MAQPHPASLRRMRNTLILRQRRYRCCPSDEPENSGALCSAGILPALFLLKSAMDSCVDHGFSHDKSSALRMRLEPLKLGPAEFDNADGDAPLYPANECVQQKG